MRYLGTKYKTYEGACKRAAFENAMAPGKVKRGDTVHLWQYKALPVGPSEYRVLVLRAPVAKNEGESR